MKYIANLKVFNQKRLTPFLYVIAFFWGTIHANAQVSDSLSLKKVLHIILDKNPILKQAEGKIGISHSKIGVAKSNRYPSVLLDGSFTYVDPVSEVSLPIGDGPVVIPLFPNDNWDVHAGIQHVLYDFGRTKEVITISKVEKLIAEEGLVAAQKELTYAATELFNSILFTEKAIEVQEKLITSLGRHLKRTNGFLENGLATSFDRVNTNVRITTAKNKKVSLQNALNNLRHHLSELLHLDTNGNELKIKGAFNIEKQRTIGVPLPETTRSELVITQQIDSILSSSQKLANKGFLPIVTVGGVTGFKNGYLPDLDESTFNYAVFAKVTVPLFQGFKVKHEKDIAQINKENNKWHIAEIETKVKNELDFAHESLENAYQQYSNTKILIEQAEISVQQARKKYENQLITNLDLLDTEVVLAGAQLSLLESEYQCIMAYYKLQKANGVKIWESTLN